MNFIIADSGLVGLEDELVYKLKICYMDIFIEDKVSDYNNWFVKAVYESILQGNKDLQDIFRANPECAYITNADNSIYQKFMQLIEPLTTSAIQLAYNVQTQFNVSTDLVGILLPYILLKTEVGNENINVFIGIAILVSQLIVQQLAEKETKNQEKEIEDSIKNICESNIKFFQELVKEDSKNSEIINQCIVENMNLLNALQNKE